MSVRLFGLEELVFASELVNVLVAFCAMEKTDEKNPPAPPGGSGVLLLGVIDSSMVGVKGTAVAFESLLGW